MRRRLIFALAALGVLAAVWAGLTLAQANGLRRRPASAGPPKLIFYAEREPERLQPFFRPEVLDQLAANGWGLSVAIFEFDRATADLLAPAFARKIPVYAWLTLPRAEGYWLSTDNWPLAPGLYDRFRRWARERNLPFAGVQLDLETPYADSRRLAQAVSEGRWSALRWYFHRARQPRAFAAGEAAYRGLLDRIRADGYETVTVTYPLALDDSRLGGAGLATLLRIPRLRADHRVFMVYRTAFAGGGSGLGAAPVASYGRDLNGGELAVGNLLEKSYGPAELRADLQVGARYSRTIWVYSLEAAATRGLLGELRALDYRGWPAISFGEAWRITVLRQGLLAASVFARPGARWIAGLVLLALAGWVVLGPPRRAGATGAGGCGETPRSHPRLAAPG